MLQMTPLLLTQPVLLVWSLLVVASTRLASAQPFLPGQGLLPGGESARRMHGVAACHYNTALAGTLSPTCKPAFIVNDSS